MEELTFSILDILLATGLLFIAGKSNEKWHFKGASFYIISSNFFIYKFE